MLIKQISVFLENRAGRLFEIAELLGNENINIRALSLADASDFGVIRLIVDKPEKAAERLKKEGFSVGLTSVVAVEVPDNPGGLASVLKVMTDAGINVEYMYAFVEKTSDNAIVIFRLENMEKTVELLLGKGLKILQEKEVLSL
ncbi:MAG: amino acid-binding protein [Lentisphaerae bacterium GWF2_44_16]|nr:MAG: amino acid-binding protein [Lentisphaerae bacterium GWF2_44_16]